MKYLLLARKTLLADCYRHQAPSTQTGENERRPQNLSVHKTLSPKHDCFPFTLRVPHSDKTYDVSTQLVGTSSPPRKLFPHTNMRLEEVFGAMRAVGFHCRARSTV